MSDEEEEEEIVDPKPSETEKCAKTYACAKALVEYEKCSERIEAKGSGNCAGQFMDYTACVDLCAKNAIFHKLK